MSYEKVIRKNGKRGGITQSKRRSKKEKKKKKITLSAPMSKWASK